jgi:uncharacterized metal-binding protein
MTLVGTNYTLDAAIASPVANDTSNTFDITHAAANQIAITSQPTNAVAGADISLTATIQDDYGNTVTTGADSTQNVTITRSGGNVTTLNGTTVKAASAGVVSFGAAESLDMTLVGTNYTLNAAITSPAVSDTSNTFDITHAAAAQIAITSQPANTAAGADISITATIQDTYGNTVTTGADSTQNVTISKSGGPVATLNGTTVKAATAGVAAFGATESLDITVFGTNYTLDASISSPVASDTSNTFDITHAAASQIAITTQPSNTQAGADITIVATIQDAFGNTVSTGADSTQNVTITRSGGNVTTLNGTTVKAAVAGVASFGAAESLDMTLVGTNYTLDASILSPAVNDTSNTFDITHAAANQIAITAQPSNTVAGADISISATIQDAYGNTVTTGADSTQNVTISRSGGPAATLNGTTVKAATAGVVSFGATESLDMTLTGTNYTLDASISSPAASDTSNTFDITHAAASQIAITSQPSNTVAGADISITATIQDTYGNTVTTGADSTQNVTITRSGGNVTLLNGTNVKAAVAGVAAFGAAESLDMTLVGTNYTLDAAIASPAVSDTSNTFDITHAAATQIAITSQPSNTVAGADISITATIRDTYGNTVTTGADSTQNVTITRSGGNVTTLNGTTVKAAVAGVAAFAAAESLDMTLVGTNYTLDAAIASPAVSDTSNTFDITHAAASQIAITSQPTNTVAGADISITATIQDTYGNTVTTGADSTQNVTITRSGGNVTTLNGTTVKAATAGDDSCRY